jgi:predicted Zn-dependent peptidase
MKIGTRLAIGAWTAASVVGCAAGMQYSSDPETGVNSVTLGVESAGEETSRQSLDRSRAPRVGEPPSLALPEVEDYVLGNGLRVVLVGRDDLPLVSLELQLRGGASAHPASKAGLAGLTADMLDEGTEARSALEIAEAVELLGATLVSSAGYDASQIRLSVLRSRFEDALEVLADLVVRPAFSEDELERVRGERIARAVQRMDRPGALADDAFIRVLYGDDHPYGAPLLGTVESLEGLTRDDVVEFHRERYAPGQATLIVAGDVVREDLDQILTIAFEGWSGPGQDPPGLADPPAATGGTVYLVDKPGASQSEVRIGRVAASRATDEYHTLTVMNTVLGGSFTSRLNMKLREEKGYTYGAGSYFDMRRANGPFEASAAISTLATDSAVADFLAEIELLSGEPVPEDELSRARNYLSLRLPQRFETTDDLVGALSSLVLYDIPIGFYEAYVGEVQGVDAQAVLDAARAWLTPSLLSIVVAGDRSEVEEDLDALGLGPVVVLPTPGSSSEEPIR